MAKRKSQGLLLFGIPATHPLNIIIIVNVLIFIFQIFAETQMLYIFALIPDRIITGSFWQVFTYGFLHSTGGIIPLHLLLNMYVLFFLWLYIEPQTGKLKLALAYLGGILGGGILVFSYSIIITYLHGTGMQMITPTIGASGGVFALLTLFGILYPDRELFVFFFIIKAKNAVIFSLASGLIVGYFFNVPISNVSHLGGTIIGLLVYLLFLKPKEAPTSTQKNEGKKKSIDFLDKQTAANDELISILHSTKENEKKIELLKKKFIKDTNICPPDTFNEEDHFCRRCDWLVNCELRKIQSPIK